MTGIFQLANIETLVNSKGYIYGYNGYMGIANAHRFEGNQVNIEIWLKFVIFKTILENIDNVWQWMTMNDNERQWMTMNDNECQ